LALDTCPLPYGRGSEKEAEAVSGRRTSRHSRENLLPYFGSS